VLHSNTEEARRADSNPQDRQQSDFLHVPYNKYMPQNCTNIDRKENEGIGRSSAVLELH
jgi:hypothetical protein